MLKYFIVFILVNCVKALTDAQGKEIFLKDILECTKDHPVEIADLEALQLFKTPTKTEVKCLLACAYRTAGMLTDKGTFDLEKGYAKAELMKEGDEKRLENGKKIVDMCIKVNDVAVSDGEKGCERATLMFDCIVKNAPKLGFKID